MCCFDGQQERESSRRREDFAGPAAYGLNGEGDPQPKCRPHAALSSPAATTPLGSCCFCGIDKGRSGDIKRVGDCEQNIQASIRLPALDERNRVRVQSGSFGELLLRESHLFPARSHGSAETVQSFVH